MESSLVQKGSSPPRLGMWLLQILKQTCRRLQRVGACARNDLSRHSRAFTYGRPRLSARSQQRPPFSAPVPFSVPHAAPPVQCLSQNVPPKAGKSGGQRRQACERGCCGSLCPSGSSDFAKVRGSHSWQPPFPRLSSRVHPSPRQLRGVPVRVRGTRFHSLREGQPLGQNPEAGKAPHRLELPPGPWI